MNENEIFEKVFRLCESDPDAGLEFIRKAVSENPELESYIFLKFCKVRAYQIKGVQPLKDRPFVKVGVAEPEELRLYLNDENLNYLEMALLEVRQIQDIDPSALKEFGEEWETQMDAMACILERCRPGRVQQILGKTKIQYFGVSRIKDSILNLTKEPILPPEELRSFLQIPFSSPSIVKSALLLQTGRDTKGRRYIECWLFRKTFDDFAPGETFGDAKVGEIYLFNDGTFAHTFEEPKEKKKEELATLLQLGQTLINDVTDKAMGVRDRSRLLTCAYLGRVSIVMGMSKDLTLRKVIILDKFVAVLHLVTLP